MLNIETDIRKTNTNKMVAYAEQGEQIKAQFAEARDKAEADITTQQEAIQNQQKVVAETYENYVLDVATLEEYQAEKSKLESLQQTLQAIQGKLASLEAVQQKKILTEVYQPMKEIQSDAQKELAKIQAEKKRQLLQRKAEYLKAIHELGNDLVKAESAVNTKLAFVKQDAGLTEMVYSSGAVQPVSDSFTHTDSYSPRKLLTVSKEDIDSLLGVKEVTGRIKNMTGIELEVSAPEAE